MNKVLEEIRSKINISGGITDLFESDKAWQEAYHNVEQDSSC